MAKSDAPTVLLIDGYSLLHRAYYALPTLTTVEGLPTNAVYGFAMMLLRLIDDVQPGYIAIAFDRPSPTFRHEAYEAYKAHRPSMPDDLRVQIGLARELIDAMKIPIFEVDGYEGDDVVGTLAKQAEVEGFRALIVTGDKDALQLVRDRVNVAYTKRGIRDVEVYDPETVQKEVGVPANRVADLKGLVGDKSDNIPGVPGIGVKTAVRLLAEYGSLEEALARAEEIAGKVGSALRKHRDDASMSKALATIDQEVPIEVDWEVLKRREPHWDRLAEIYRRLEFRTLLENLEKQSGQGAGKGQGDESREEGAAKRSPPIATVLRNSEAVRTALDASSKGAEWVVYPVWSGSRPLDGDLVGIGLVVADAPYYIPLETLTPGEKNRILESLGQALQHVSVVGHDVKALMLLLEKPLESITILDDVMIQGYLVAPGKGDQSLDDLALKYDAPKPVSIEDVTDDNHRAVAQAVSSNLETIKELRRTLAGRLEQDDLESLYREIELPLVRVLADMERTGVRLDVEALRHLAGEFGDQIEAIQTSIFTLAGEEFNLNSPKQMGEVLFGRLGLPVIRKTKTGPSTSADVLETLAEEHEIVSQILEYRQLQKLKSTYADALPGLVRPNTGRVHTTFNQTVAATGRLSSTNPNLQNIPVRTEAGRRIRRAFVPRDGYTLIKADYSQIELRVLAHIAQDETMLKAFRDGADIHTQTAAEIFGVPQDDVTREMREAAKAINFGIVYGISSFGLARDSGLTQGEAREFIDRYFERYPQVAGYMQETVESARVRGYVTTLFGRRRYLPDIESRKWNTRKMAERTAINSPIQGSAADIIKKAMVAVHRRLTEEGAPASILLQVHDELVLECDERCHLDIAHLLKEEMEGVARLDASLCVEVGAGPNWLDIQPIL